jgi:hypothetical protein
MVLKIYITMIESRLMSAQKVCGQSGAATAFFINRGYKNYAINK